MRGAGESFKKGSSRFPQFGASAINCWWDQHNPIMFNMLLAEMILVVLKCGKYKLSHYVC